MTRPRLLDLFCGAGGAGTGYYRAGFDVVGVDVVPQPRYPFTFAQAGALESLASWNLSGIAAIHASPPCQDHSRLHARTTVRYGTGWLLDATRKALEATGLPWVIENVSGAPMRADYRLCGCMTGLPKIRRERWFETSWHGFALLPAHHHPEPAFDVIGHPGGTSARDARPKGSLADWRKAMDCLWMSARELSQAIPPAYTQLIGADLMDVVTAA